MKKENLLLFKYEDNESFSDVRSLEINGELWFVAIDIATALGYKNTRSAIAQHCKDRGVVIHDTPTKSGIQKMVLISEANVYRLVVKSQLPTAEKFESWIFETVIPQIRKQGYYKSPELLPTYSKRILSEPTKHVPAGYWSIFDESHSIMLLVEKHLGSYSKYDLIDGSIGKRWSAYRKNKNWAAMPTKTYPHEFEDNRGVRDCLCYHNDEIFIFKGWLKNVYRTEHLAEYLNFKYATNIPMLERVREVFPKQLKGGEAA